MPAFPREAHWCLAMTRAGLEMDQTGTAGTRDRERDDPFSAPASLMGAGMSLGKLRTTELDLPTATHPLPWQRKWSLLQPTASSPKHTSPGEQLGVPSISGVPGFSKYGMAEALLGESCPSSLGDLLELDAPPSPHILELPSILWVLSRHAAKTGQAMDKPPRASGTQGPCLQFCKICGPQPVLPQWGLQNQALGPITLPSRQAARQETPGLSLWLCCVCSHGWTEYGEWLCLLTIPPPPPP